MASILESLKITNPRDSHFSRKFWNTFIDKLAALVRPYKVYVALISQTGENAPTATVLEDTLGVGISFQRTGVGLYKITFSESIITDTNHVIIQGAGNQSSLAALWIYTNYNGTELIFECYGLGNINTTIPLMDSILTNQLIEIRVYN